MTELTPYFVILLAFTAATAVVFVVGRLFVGQLRVQQRVATPPVGSHGAENFVSADFTSAIATYFDEQRFGVEGLSRSKLRRDLLRAGFFHPNAINYYIFARIALVICLPLIMYVTAELFLAEYHWGLKLGAVTVMMVVAILGPDAYISRRQRALVLHYRSVFPELLDLLVVCVDAGLSLEAAFNRIATEIANQSKTLSMNLQLMGAEIRAGRSMIDALDSLTDRLGLEEARSFVAMIRQSIELGTDIGDALRVFSDEMRDRRLMRAEEKANQVPVKMVIPLGLFIFPVILMVILVPVIIRLLSVMH